MLLHRDLGVKDECKWQLHCRGWVGGSQCCRECDIEVGILVFGTVIKESEK